MRRVLWVEDDIAMMAGLGHFLREHDLSVDTAPDVESALRLLEAEHYDAAIVDLVLPSLERLDRLGGLEVAQAIREKDRKEPLRPPTTIVVLSAFSARDFTKRMEDLNIKFLSKVDLSGGLDSLVGLLKASQGDTQ